jgi:urease accessory protein
MMNAQSLLSLLYLSSPALPVGAFAYSQGLETAIDKGWVTDENALTDWISGILTNGLALQDLPLFYRLYDAWQAEDSASVVHWNQWVFACRESAELVMEEEQMGKSIMRLLNSLGKTPTTEVCRALTSECGFVAAFALAAVRFDVPAKEAAMGLCWSWMENQVTVSCKTIPLGQTKAQQVLMKLMPLLQDAIEQSLYIQDEDIGATLPGFAMASAFHETQYSRLFRS